MPREKSVEIDSAFDFNLVKLIMKNKSTKYGKK